MKRLLCFLGLVVLVAVGVMPVSASDSDWAARVRDDGNNLRTFGGADYKKAEIVGVLNEDDRVKVWDQDGKWYLIGAGNGLGGWVHAGCLEPVANELGTEPLPQELRNRLDAFLSELNNAAASRDFMRLSPLISLSGVVLDWIPFRDAHLGPERQSDQIVPMWYATDVSLTMGTAWELLVIGTNPPTDRDLMWDEDLRNWRMVNPDEKAEFANPPGPVEGVLPLHANALRLAPDARLVNGFPIETIGYEMSEEPDWDFENIPFSLVYKVGKGTYRLEQKDHLGLILVVSEDKAGSLRLAGVMCQAF